MAFNNGLSTISGSDSRFFCLSTPPISSIKSLKFSSVRFPSRFASFKVRAQSVAEPYSSSSASAPPPPPLSSFSELSFYEILGIPENGSFSDIKQAYKKLARKYHPDVSPPGRVDEFTQMFLLVHEAYETLSDPTRRAIYDITRGMASYDDAVKEIKKGWRAHWEAQLAGLENRTYKFGDRSQSWASLIRQTRNEKCNN